MRTVHYAARPPALSTGRFFQASKNLRFFRCKGELRAPEILSDFRAAH
jgi:hypothetical protein